MNLADVVYDEECARLHDIILDATGVNATVINAGCGPGIDYALRSAGRFQQVCDGLRDRWTKAIHARQAREAFAEGRHAMIFSANNPPADAGFADGWDQLRWLEWFHRMGFRIMHLTYNRRNWVGDGCMEEANGGLSAFGRMVVEAMNDLGIVIDTPHTGERTTLRGKTDEQIRAIAEKGGFIGITCVPHFLREGGGTIVDLLDHVEHAIKVAGIDHVGIGTDTGYVVPPPSEPQMLPLPRSRQQWWSWWLPGTLDGGNDEARDGSIAWVAWPYFTVGLLMRGYSEEDVAKVVGLNALTLFEEVERTATVHVRGA